MGWCEKVFKGGVVSITVIPPVYFRRTILSLEFNKKKRKKQAKNASYKKPHALSKGPP